MARPVGRPPLPYDVKHVTVNMKQAHYVRMRRDGVNMSKLINDFLDDRFAFGICPSCYGDDFEVRICKKCTGRMLCCRNIACKQYGSGQGRECLLNPDGTARHPETVCTVAEFYG